LLPLLAQDRPLTGNSASMNRKRCVKSAARRCDTESNNGAEGKIDCDGSNEVISKKIELENK